MMTGIHIQKKGKFLDSLKKFFEQRENKNIPVQLFTGSPKFWRRNISPDDLINTRKYVDENNLTVFIHSIYLINLCKSSAEFNDKAKKNLIWELKTGAQLGFKGVVVHCGKSLKMDKEKALFNMYNNMCSVVEHIDPSCPLLLETSSGQGSETLYNYNDFKDFYNRFGEGIKEKIKICIDTCHVFAAGHAPLKFIMDWNKDCPNSIALVHFNDSKEKCGEKKDRHEYPGEGYIGIKKLDLVNQLCKKLNIPMIMEI